MSIRIPSGQSLHWEELQSATAGTLVEITIEGPQVVPYPKEATTEVAPEVLLKSHGVALGEGWSATTIEGAGSVWYAAKLTTQSAQLIARLKDVGATVRLNTPLEGVVVAAVAATRQKKNIILHQTTGCLYVAYAENHRLQYAEALPIEGEEELVNLLALLNRDYDLRRGEFTLVGDQSTGYYKLVRKYFRHVRCEK